MIYKIKIQYYKGFLYDYVKLAYLIGIFQNNKHFCEDIVYKLGKDLLRAMNCFLNYIDKFENKAL